ncbi:MAG TPA: TIGR04141 family sporadically distributed protein [Alphaproteobacteria bacterium]|nr:TIGR04141 family sporadically distributed protein [Alphaproteobacteria bacterium]
MSLWEASCCVGSAIKPILKRTLSAGEWYSVVRSFVDRINAEIAQIPDAALNLPAFRSGEDEGEYNCRAAQAPDVHLFDRSLITFEGERGRVEFCDLLTEARQIVHVKKRAGSAVLSHLFMQGFVSGEAFLDHQDLRRQIRERIPAIQHLIRETPPNGEDYEIVYALLHDGTATLPFFSKVALAGIHKQLRRMRYRVGIRWIAQEAADAA